MALCCALLLVLGGVVAQVPAQRGRLEMALPGTRIIFYSVVPPRARWECLTHTPRPNLHTRDHLFHALPKQQQHAGQCSNQRFRSHREVRIVVPAVFFWGGGETSYKLGGNEPTDDVASSSRATGGV